MRTSAATPNQGPERRTPGGGSYASEFRAQRFRWAVASSLSSKVTTAALQLVAMPVAAKYLGSHGFSLYAMLSALVVWLWLSNFGIGPALTVAIASAHARGDAAAEKRLFASALLPVLAISFGVSVLAMVAIWTLPIQVVFGPEYVADVAAIRGGLTALVAMFFVQMNLSAIEAGQTGYQEQHIINLTATFSSIPCIGAIIAVAKWDATVVTIILAVNAPVVLFRAGNAYFALRRHPQMTISFRYFDRAEWKRLFHHGSTFSLASAVAHILSHVFPVILVGRHCDAASSAAFAATMNALVLASGVYGMVCTPMWPAIADSVSRHEWGWARKVSTKLIAACLSYAVVFSGIFAVFGKWIFSFWFRGAVMPGQLLLTSASVYFVLWGWELSHFTVLTGLRRIVAPSVVICARSVVALIAMIFGLRSGNAAVPFISMCAAVILVDAIPLRAFVSRGFSGVGADAAAQVATASENRV